MGMKIEGELRIVADGCTPIEMGVEASRHLLGLVVDPMRDQNAPKLAMQDLLLGLLAGTVGHFAQDLSVEVIHAQLDNCKRMVSEALVFTPGAQMPSAGKAVH